jgi:pilus assembly protein CpaF
LFANLGKKDWTAEIRKLQNIRETGLSDSMQRWIMRAEKEIGKNHTLSNAGAVLPFALFLSAAGFWFGMAVLGNLAAAMLMAAIGVLLPEQVLYNRQQAEKEKMMEQLGTAVRMFAAEYIETPNSIRAINQIANQLPDPIGAVFQRVAKNFSSGKSVDEVLIGLSQKLNFEYGRLFVQLLRLSFEDSAVGPMFTGLSAKLAGQQKLIRKGRVDVALDRGMVVGMNLGIIPAYYIASRMVPEAPMFFTQTAAGRSIVVLCLISAITGMVLDRFLNRGGEAD